MKNQDTGFYLKIINDEIVKRRNLELKKYDLYCSQTEFLKYLLKCDDEKASLKQIMNHFNLQHPTVIGVMQRLEKNGFVISFKEKKMRLYKVTQKAYELKKTLSEGRIKMEATLNSAFSENELEQFKFLLQKLYLHLLEGSK